MATKQRGRVFVRSEDGRPTTVSSRGGNFAAGLCRRHRIANLGDAANVGLLPAFADLDLLQREADRVLRAPTFDREAERRVGKARAGRDQRNRRARVTSQATSLRAAELAGVIEAQLPDRARNELAVRSLQVLTRAPIDIVRFELEDQDLDLHTDLVFARDVTLATIGDLRIFRGAALVFAASSFILRAASARGNVLAVEAEHSAGVSLNDHLLHL